MLLESQEYLMVTSLLSERPDLTLGDPFFNSIGKSDAYIGFARVRNSIRFESFISNNHFQF